MKKLFLCLLATIIVLSSLTTLTACGGSGLIPNGEWEYDNDYVESYLRTFVVKGNKIIDRDGDEWKFSITKGEIKLTFLGDSDDGWAEVYAFDKMSANIISLNCKFNCPRFSKSSQLVLSDYLVSGFVV